jgi:hypothetical protein
VDRVADLAAQLIDEAMLRVQAGLGEAPISYQAELAAHRAAQQLVHAAVEAAVGRYRAAAEQRPGLTL